MKSFSFIRMAPEAFLFPISKCSEKTDAKLYCEKESSSMAYLLTVFTEANTPASLHNTLDVRKVHLVGHCYTGVRQKGIPQVKPGCMHLYIADATQEL